MGKLKAITNQKVQGGLGRRNPSTDSIFGLVAGGVTTASYTTLGDIVKLEETQDAVDLGLGASYDANNGVLVHYHVSEFFRRNPNGTMYLMLVSQKTGTGGVSLTDMVDKANEHVKKMVQQNTDIKYVGCVLNPDLATYASTTTNDIDADVEAAIPKAQALVDELLTQNIYLDGIMLEGREADMTSVNLPDLRALDAESVSVVIGQDPAQAAVDSAFANHAGVGAALGDLSVRKVNVSLGSTDVANKPEAFLGQEMYPLTSEAESKWLDAADSAGNKISALTNTEINSVDGKGYIFAAQYEGADGFFWNDSHTCTELADDYAYIENNRTWNKAARYVLAALTPKIKGEIDVDGDTGFIAASTIGGWEAAGDKRVRRMLEDDEISSFDFFIDPKQNVLSSSEVATELEVVPKGTARKIKNKIGFNNPF